MTQRLSDVEIAEAMAAAANAQTDEGRNLARYVFALLAHIDALEAENKDLRRKIADGITRWGESERIEYGVLRPAVMPDMSGEPTWIQIVSTTFRSLEAARTAQENVPASRDREAVIMQRRAPGPWLPVEEDQG